MTGAGGEERRRRDGDPIREGTDDRTLPPPEARRERAWPRAAGLFAVTLLLAVAEPAVLVGVPFLLCVLFLPGRRLAAFLAGGLVGIFLFAVPLEEGLWYVERGWAVLVGSWFAALTLARPAARFLPRALGAVGGSVALAGSMVAVRPDAWPVVDWLVGDRMRSGVSAALEGLRQLRREEGLSEALVTGAFQAVEAQVEVFPAMLALASLAGLGVAWWLYLRLAHRRDGGLEPVREFRFNDHLVWLFILGLLALVMGRDGGWERLGLNAAVFMGALYALRGVGVVVFFSGGVSLLGYVLFAVGLLLAGPVIAVGATVIGLGDTWLDLRGRARELAA